MNFPLNLGWVWEKMQEEEEVNPNRQDKLEWSVKMTCFMSRSKLVTELGLPEWQIMGPFGFILGEWGEENKTGLYWVWCA